MDWAYLNSREDKQTHFTYKKYNSFVSSKPLIEFEVGLMDLGTMVKPMRYGPVAVDGFTEVVSVIPIQNTQVNEIIRGLEEVFATMGKPQQIYSNEEGAMNSDTVLSFIKNLDFNTYEHQHMPTQPSDSCKPSA